VKRSVSRMPYAPSGSNREKPTTSQPVAIVRRVNYLMRCRFGCVNWNTATVSNTLACTDIMTMWGLVKQVKRRKSVCYVINLLMIMLREAVQFRVSLQMRIYSITAIFYFSMLLQWIIFVCSSHPSTIKHFFWHQFTFYSIKCLLKCFTCH
jgi:hypothetical protein